MGVEMINTQMRRVMYEEAYRKAWEKEAFVPAGQSAELTRTKKHIIKALRVRPMTALEVGEVACLSAQDVGAALRDMEEKGEAGQIKVKGRHDAPLWELFEYDEE